MITQFHWNALYNILIIKIITNFRYFQKTRGGMRDGNLHRHNFIKNPLQDWSGKNCYEKEIRDLSVPYCKDTKSLLNQLEFIDK